MCGSQARSALFPIGNLTDTEDPDIPEPPEAPPQSTPVEESELTLADAKEDPTKKKRRGRRSLRTDFKSSQAAPTNTGLNVPGSP